ncbi:helix-turn-helix domain-containing protein [Corynebacterium propinquum]|nr:helix-turn-helix domain-containing protein [Corynebacterium propinquum]WKS42803.1 helix-turn-helix domain-containing protein [Corynebacterium propinquum]
MDNWAQIRVLHAQGMSIRKIAAEVGCAKNTCFDVVVRLLRYADVLAELLDRDALTDGVEIRYLLAESNGNCNPHIVNKPESKKSMDSESKKSLDITATS